MNVKLGETVWRVPYALTEGAVQHPPIPGRVVWIHPAGRFFVLRFTFEKGCFCESYTE